MASSLSYTPRREPFEGRPSVHDDLTGIDVTGGSLRLSSFHAADPPRAGTRPVAQDPAKCFRQSALPRSSGREARSDRTNTSTALTRPARGRGRLAMFRLPDHDCETWHVVRSPRAPGIR